MRGAHERDLSSKINVLLDRTGKPKAPMALLHHELSAENAVIPFSLSLPASHIQASLAPSRWSFPRDEYCSPRSPYLPRQHFSRL